MDIRKKLQHSFFIVAPLFFLLSSCDGFQNFSSSNSGGTMGNSGISLNGKSHDSGAARAKLENLRGKGNIHKTSSASFHGDERVVRVALPKNRCESGVMSFGSSDSGGSHLCSALGRGRTEWSKPTRNITVSCFNRSYTVRPSQWIENKTSQGTSCWYLSGDSLPCSNTPDGTYRIPGSTSSPGRHNWGGQSAVSIQPMGNAPGRGSLLVHTDGDFASSPFIDGEGHSTQGCIKLAPDCQRDFINYVKKNSRKGLKLVVEEI